MTEFIFPRTGAHCVSINGLNLVFSPGMGIPLLVNKAAFGLVKRCSGMSLTRSREWLRERYGEESVYVAEQFRQIVEAGYFCMPHDKYVMSRDEWRATVPPLWYKIAETYKMDVSQETKMKPCAELKEMGVVIGPDGSMYTCQGFGGNPEFAVGHIDTGVDNEAYVEHYGLMPWYECMGKCSMITWCWAWCRSIAYNKLGDWKAKLCQRKDLIDDALIYYRFKHRERIAKWLHNRANGIEDAYEDYKEISVSHV